MKDEQSQSPEKRSGERSGARSTSGIRRGGFRKRIRKIRQPIDYKDVEFLTQFITDQGKIMPRRLTRVCAKDQRRICTAIKRARMVGLLPFAKRA